jgi:hypothetical protein
MEASLIAFARIVLLLIAYSATAHAQSSRGDCAQLLEVVGSSTGNVPRVPDSFVADWRSSLPCMIQAVENLRDVDGPEFSPASRRVFLSVTGAMRTIITAQNAADERASDAKQQNLRDFIDTYRKRATIDSTRVMAFGARSNDPNIRLNALLVMANVIDNRVLCVPIDYLYDPQIAATDYGVRGRANLIAIVSVVAPWAYRENFANLKRLSAFLKPLIGPEDDFKQSRDALENLNARLQSQEKLSSSNKDVTGETNFCSGYHPKFAPSDKLTYPRS